MANFLQSLICIAVPFCFATELSAEVVNISPGKDNTLYESATGSLSNGAGDYLFAGRTGQPSGSIRRALVAFDVAGAVPAGSVITDASLTMHMNKDIAPAATAVNIHLVTADWGEGLSHADDEEGGGAAATTNDATWTNRFFSTALNWTTPGGDFSPTATASTDVGAVGFYAWTGPQLLADVAGWHSTPATNFGWIVIGDEATAASAKRFASRTNPTTANRPVLTIEYTPVSAVPNWTLY